MFEPIYQNTSESTTDASGVVMDERQLLSAVSDCQRTFRRGDPEKELKDKYRWMVINIINETQFSIRYAQEWFDVGRFWSAPCNMAAFSYSAFSVSSTYWGAAGHHGVSGAALFYLQIPSQDEDYPITIAFSNPSIGSIKTRAEFSCDLKEVWKIMDKQITHSDDTVTSIGGHSIRFSLTSTPGNQAVVSLTQVDESLSNSSVSSIKLLSYTELNDARKESQQFKFYEPSKELRDKFRWIIVNIANETQFNIKYAKEWFDVGRFWDAPCNVAKFSHSAYSGCSTYWGAAGHHGVSGAALFYLQVPGQGEDHPITIAFSNPGTGSIKTRAEFCDDMKEVWKRMVKQCTSHAEKDIRLHCTRIKLQLTSTPGTQALVTVTHLSINDATST